MKTKKLADFQICISVPLIKSQIIEYCVLRTNLYQTGAQSSILFQSLLLTEAERQSSICLKLEITFAIIKLL